MSDIQPGTYTNDGRWVWDGWQWIPAAQQANPPQPQWQTPASQVWPSGQPAGPQQSIQGATSGSTGRPSIPRPLESSGRGSSKSRSGSSGGHPLLRNRLGLTSLALGLIGAFVVPVLTLQLHLNGLGWLGLLISLAGIGVAGTALYRVDVGKAEGITLSVVGIAINVVMTLTYIALLVASIWLTSVLEDVQQQLQPGLQDLRPQLGLESPRAGGMSPAP